MEAQNIAEKKNAEPIGVLYGLRAIMVAFVAAFHFYQQSWLSQKIVTPWFSLDLTPLVYAGYLFVDGMMLLSGFLLYLPCARGKEPPSPKEFWYKRIRRILPSYIVAVLVSFLVALLADGSYGDGSFAAEDLLSHLLFLQMFRYETYLGSPINGALWSIVVEMQFYLLFPFLCRAAKKKPALTLLSMALIAWGYRYAAANFFSDCSCLVNQLPAYLDVFALGMLGAMLYPKLKGLEERSRGAGRVLLQCGATGLFLLACYGLYLLGARQSASGRDGYEALRHSQMLLELPFSALILVCIFCADLALKPLRWLLGSTLARFLAGISMHFYIWHQFLAVRLRLKWFPDASALHASQSSQTLYSTLCWLTAFAAAMIFTYGIERPVARGLDRLTAGLWHPSKSKSKQTEVDSHERSQNSETQQGADPLFPEAPEGRALAHRKLRQPERAGDRPD